MCPGDLFRGAGDVSPTREGWGIVAGNPERRRHALCAPEVCSGVRHLSEYKVGIKIHPVLFQERRNSSSNDSFL